MSGGREQRRAELAIDEAQDVREAAQKLRNDAEGLTRELDEAMADGDITPEEAKRIAQRARQLVEQAGRTQVEAAQVVVATEWTSVGELQAIAKLTGRDSARAAIREMDVQRRAIDVGLVLHT